MKLVKTMTEKLGGKAFFGAGVFLFSAVFSLFFWQAANSSVDLKLSKDSIDWSDSISGSAPLNNVDLEATIINLSGPFNYKFSCGYYDVIVVGGGSSGVAAAIQAARLGSRVLLLEESSWLGGQMAAAGVSTMDEGSTERESGIYKEFINRIVAEYQNRGKSVNTCYWGGWGGDQHCFEPSVVQQVLREMLASAGSIETRLLTKVTGVEKSGNLVTGVTTSQGQQYTAKVVIDATEYGDVIPLTGARYRLGNSTSDSPNSNACIQDITYTAVLKKYSPSVPANLLLPSLTNQTDIQSYNANKSLFVQYLTLNGSSWYPGNGYPYNWVTHIAFRGMPDSTNPGNYTAADSTAAASITKTGVNWANDYPGNGLTLKVSYLEDLNERKRVNCEAELKTLQFIYYVQHDLGLPWSFANDEYSSVDEACNNLPAEFKPFEKYLPPIPYVRESRRLIGLHTLTAREIKRPVDPQTQNLKSAVAIGGYGADLHNCRSDQTLETAFESTADFSEYGSFQIPLESFIPESIDGFLAAEKNISQTRITNGATRLQPSTMLIGQAAGTIAALSVRLGIQPRRFVDNPVPVQDELLKAGSILSLYTFSDVPFGSALWVPVQMTSLRQIMTGYSNSFFGVSDSLTREQAAVVLARLFDLVVNNPPATPTFSDVPKTSWAYPYVEAIYRAGITSGCGGGKFCPVDPSTKEQMAVFLVRGLKWDPTGAPDQNLSDVSPSSWAVDFVNLVLQKGIMELCSVSPKQFCPERAVTRGETAKIILNVLRLSATSAITPTPGSNWDLEVNNTNVNPYITSRDHTPAFYCSYSALGTYTAKVRVEKGAVTLEDTAQVTTTGGEFSVCSLMNNNSCPKEHLGNTQTAEDCVIPEKENMWSNGNFTIYNSVTFLGSAILEIKNGNLILASGGTITVPSEVTIYFHPGKEIKLQGGQIFLTGGYILNQIKP